MSTECRSVCVFMSFSRRRILSRKETNLTLTNAGWFMMSRALAITLCPKRLKPPSSVFSSSVMNFQTNSSIWHSSSMSAPK